MAKNLEEIKAEQTEEDLREQENNLDSDEMDELDDISENDNPGDDDSDDVRGSDRRENAIEWYTRDDRVTVTLTQQRFKSKVKDYATKYPEEVKIIAENDDGSLYAHIPLRYLKISRPREISEEQRAAAAERLAKYREQKDS